MSFRRSLHYTTFGNKKSYTHTHTGGGGQRSNNTAPNSRAVLGFYVDLVF